MVEPKHHEVQGVREAGGKVYYQLKYNPELFKDASCKGIDTEVFYPDKVSFTREEERFYNNLCSRCPVLEACLEWGLAHENYGIWGGLTPALRTEYRKALRWGVSDLTAGAHLPL